MTKPRINTGVLRVAEVARAKASLERTAESLASIWRDVWLRTAARLDAYSPEDREEALCLMSDCVRNYKALTGRELDPTEAQ